jgi:hypothetical protein
MYLEYIWLTDKVKATTTVAPQISDNEINLIVLASNARIGLARPDLRVRSQLIGFLEKEMSNWRSLIKKELDLQSRSGRTDFPAERIGRP